VIEIGKRFGMTALRVPSEPIGVLRRIETQASSAESFVTAASAAYLRARLRRHRLRTTDRVFGLAWSGAMTEQRVAGLLMQLPDGVTEIYCHPATSDKFAGAVPGSRYADELAALTSRNVATAVNRAGIQLTNYCDLLSDARHQLLR
jgi:predicted glycoside hydrolase/deacetylase ChbG (UPF0249 family)